MRNVQHASGRARAVRAGLVELDALTPARSADATAQRHTRTARAVSVPHAPCGTPKRWLASVSARRSARARRSPGRGVQEPGEAPRHALGRTSPSPARWTTPAPRLEDSVAAAASPLASVAADGRARHASPRWRSGRGHRRRKGTGRVARRGARPPGSVTALSGVKVAPVSVTGCPATVHAGAGGAWPLPRLERSRRGRHGGGERSGTPPRLPRRGDVPFVTARPRRPPDLRRRCRARAPARGSSAR